jgi:acyl carrier protein
MNGATSELRTFIGGRFPQAQLADDEDIFELGFVDSLFAAELVMFIESRFEFTIPNEELTLDNFRTVALMSELVARNDRSGARSA